MDKEWDDIGGGDCILTAPDDKNMACCELYAIVTVAK